MMLTEKESALMKDMKNTEQLCAEKYQRHAEDAYDGQLKELFSRLAITERGHYDTLCRMESGNLPAPGNEPTEMTFRATYSAAPCKEKEADAYLCADLLAAEKHTSHLYDTCIFEFQSEQNRNILSHIQKEEQKHGKQIYDYMKTNHMIG